MSERHNLSDYHYGEAFAPEVTLARDGDPVTSGTVVLRLALTAGGVPGLSITGSHAGAGVWNFSATDDQMSFAPEGGVIYYNVWDTDTDRLYAYGSLAVKVSIT